MPTLKTKAHTLYQKAFSTHEIESDVALQWFAGAILLGFFATFKNWFGGPTNLQAVEKGVQACWPFFQNCESWFFLGGYPQSYQQETLFALLFGAMVGITYLMLQKKWTQVHLGLLLLFVVKLYLVAISFRYKPNYDFYHTIFCLVFLFLPHKRFFAQLAIVSLYVMSTMTKIHPGWTLGTYFSSLKTGLPVFPHSTIPVWTNLVIAAEMVGSWFLFSRHYWLQRAALGFFIIFHLYSGFLVYYHYPSIVLPSLIILFGPWFKPYSSLPFDFKSIAGWSLISIMFALQSISHFIPGDEKLTMEGNFYGLFMFEANHQCRKTITDSTGRLMSQEKSDSARRRCDPYAAWSIAKNQYCKKSEFGVGPYSLQVDHSINGGPFYRIVDEADLCQLEYKPFSHNHWIKTEQTAKPVGLPFQNFYY